MKGAGPATVAEGARRERRERRTLPASVLARPHAFRAASAPRGREGATGMIRGRGPPPPGAGRLVVVKRVPRGQPRGNESGRVRRSRARALASAGAPRERRGAPHPARPRRRGTEAGRSSRRRGEAGHRSGPGREPVRGTPTSAGRRPPAPRGARAARCRLADDIEGGAERKTAPVRSRGRSRTPARIASRSCLPQRESVPGEPWTGGWRKGVSGSTEGSPRPARGSVPGIESGSTGAGSSCRRTRRAGCFSITSRRAK